MQKDCIKYKGCLIVKKELQRGILNIIIEAGIAHSIGQRIERRKKKQRKRREGKMHVTCEVCVCVCVCLCVHAYTVYLATILLLCGLRVTVREIHNAKHCAMELTCYAVQAVVLERKGLG